MFGCEEGSFSKSMDVMESRSKVKGRDKRKVTIQTLVSIPILKDTKKAKKKRKKSHLNVSIISLPLPLRRLLPILPLKDLPAVLVELDRRNDEVRRVDTNGRGGAVGLVPCDALDVHDVLLAVHLRDFALAPLVLPAHDPDLIVLADGERAALL